MQDFNFNIGGPIMKDKLWFFTHGPPRVGRRGRRQLVLSGRLPRTARASSTTTGDPSIQHQYVRDVARPPHLPGQPEDKDQLVSRAHLEAQGSGTALRLQPDHRIGHPRSACTRCTTSAQAKITSTLTNRLLLEAGYSTNLERLSQQYQPFIEDIADQPFTPAWYQQVTHSASNGNIWGAAPGGSTGTYPDRKVLPAALSYVTGSHSLKVGTQWSFGVDGNSQIRTGDLVQNYVDVTGKTCTKATRHLLAVHGHGLQHADAYFEYVNDDLGFTRRTPGRSSG